MDAVMTDSSPAVRNILTALNRQSRTSAPVAMRKKKDAVLTSCF